MSALNSLDRSFFSPKRSAEVSTLPRHLVTGNVAIATGQVVACRADVQTGQNYSKCRFSLTPTFANATDFKIGVWDLAGNLLGNTANLSATVNGGATTVTDNVALAAAIALAEGAGVLLGVGALGQTAGGLRAQGGSMTSTVITLAPSLMFASAGWAGGALPNLASSAAISQIPWVELIP